MRVLPVVVVFSLIGSGCGGERRADGQVPVRTPTTTELVGRSAPAAMHSVLRVICKADNTGGTGFVHKSGLVISAEHVVSPCQKSDLQLVLSTGRSLGVTAVTTDARRDLALLKPEIDLSGPTLTLSSLPELQLGDPLAAWGYPAGYRGLRPLLTVGYLAGEDRPGPAGSPSQSVVNAAFNAGNSGGPVVRLEDGAVVGVVSSKLAPLPRFIELEIAALSEAEYGLQFKKQEPGREAENVSEAQVVAEVLTHLRKQTQLVVGYAVKLGEIRDFLRENEIDP